MYFLRCPPRLTYSICLCSLYGCASPREAAVPRDVSIPAPGPRITSTPRLPKVQKGRDVPPASPRQQGRDFPLPSQTSLTPNLPHPCNPCLSVISLAFFSLLLNAGLLVTQMSKCSQALEGTMRNMYVFA